MSLGIRIIIVEIHCLVKFCHFSIYAPFLLQNYLFKKKNMFRDIFLIRLCSFFSLKIRL